MTYKHMNTNQALGTKKDHLIYFISFHKKNEFKSPKIAYIYFEKIIIFLIIDFFSKILKNGVTKQ
jgi:hypothetical protein